ncbi:MAG: DUF1338 domain-containing protein [Crinalium sp.]
MNSPQIPLNLWNKLWENYSHRVNYAQIYQQMIATAGGTIANDHIAFRSLRLNVDTPQGTKNLGIDYLEKIANALGYQAAAEYTFPDQKLYARHYQHPEQDALDLPKLFISELIVDQLPDAIAQLIYQTVKSVKLADVQTLVERIKLADTELEAEQLTDELQLIYTRPWNAPFKSVVETVNTVSQYGAWVLLHGYAVNHFTGYINRQNTPLYPDIETTVKGLTDRNVPMKSEIEGDLKSGLRQTATKAVQEMVTVIDDTSKQEVSIPWTYAYYEIAERALVEVTPGEKVLFQGFKGANAQQLFEMTRKV